MTHPKKSWMFTVEPGTLLLVVAALLLIPLILAGFLSQSMR